MVLGADAIDSSIPMEVDRVQSDSYFKGKGKGKFDSKGEGGKNRDGKGQDMKGKG